MFLNIKGNTELFIVNVIFTYIERFNPVLFYLKGNPVNCVYMCIHTIYI